jgi:hypothetical protein
MRISDALFYVRWGDRSPAKLFITYLTVFLVTSFVAGVFLFLYSGIKTSSISSELAFSLIATLSLTLQVFTVWYLLRRNRPDRPPIGPRPKPSPRSEEETKAHMVRNLVFNVTAIVSTVSQRQDRERVNLKNKLCELTGVFPLVAISAPGVKRVTLRSFQGC